MQSLPLSIDGLPHDDINRWENPYRLEPPSSHDVIDRYPPLEGGCHREVPGGGKDYIGGALSDPAPKPVLLYYLLQ